MMDEHLLDMLAKKRREEATDDATWRATLSGAGSGAVLGGASALLGGLKPWQKVAKTALAGAGISAGIAGGGTFLGSQVLGAPEPDEDSAYTTRAGLGASLAGGAIGAGLGALAGHGSFSKSAIGRKVAQQFGGLADNIVGQGFKKLTAMGGREGAKRGAIAGGLAGAALGGYQGADEGMQVDFIQAQLDKQRRERYRQLMQEQALQEGGL